MFVTTAWQVRAALPWCCRNCISWLLYKRWPHAVACTHVAVVLCCMLSRVSLFCEIVVHGAPHGLRMRLV
jgi:hypothetical protein